MGVEPGRITHEPNPSVAQLQHRTNRFRSTLAVLNQNTMCDKVVRGTVDTHHRCSELTLAFEIRLVLCDRHNHQSANTL